MDEFKCAACDRTFDTKESYEQHNASKHKNGPAAAAKKSFKIKKRYLVLAIGVILLLLFANWTYSSYSAPGQYDEFAKCMTLKDVKFYGAFWCPHCAEQKAMFGKSTKYLNYIECSTPDRSGQTAICIDKKIESYPTWEFSDGSRLAGVVSIQSLSEKSGCAASAPRK